MPNRMLCGLVVLTICVLSPFSIKPVNAEGNEVEISTNPQKVFFEITNSKPGDTYIKVLTIQNNGSQNLSYLFSNRFLTGSEEFYNALLFKVTDKSGVLYNGNLKDFDKLAPRFLKRGKSEDLTLSISVPSELGNKYQGLNTEFQFKFYVEGTLGGLLPADGLKLPATGSIAYNALVSGFVFIMLGTFLKYKDKIQK